MDANILVSVAKHPKLDISDVSKKLSQAGMNIVDVLKLSRIVTGTVDEKKIPVLREVPGVASVDLDVEFTAH
ncbi:MAG: hypothetical protein AAF266_14250 [Planctomycetota bacterium]